MLDPPAPTQQAMMLLLEGSFHFLSYLWPHLIVAVKHLNLSDFLFDDLSICLYFFYHRSGSGCIRFLPCGDGSGGVYAVLAENYHSDDEHLTTTTAAANATNNAADKQPQQQQQQPQQPRLSLKEQYRNAKLQERQLHQEHQLHHLQQLTMVNQQQPPSSHPRHHKPHHLSVASVASVDPKESKLHWAERKAEQLRLRYTLQTLCT